MGNTTTVHWSVERYIEDKDEYVEDNLVCTVVCYPAEPDVGLMSADAEIDEVECNGEPYPYDLSKATEEKIKIEALEEYEQYMSTPRHKRHLLADL